VKWSDGQRVAAGEARPGGPAPAPRALQGRLEEQYRRLKRAEQRLPLTSHERAAVLEALRGLLWGDDFDAQWIAEFVRRSARWDDVPPAPALGRVRRGALVRKLEALPAVHKLALAAWAEHELWRQSAAGREAS
jgi:hypothetical protein